MRPSSDSACLVFSGCALARGLRLEHGPLPDQDSANSHQVSDDSGRKT